MLAEITGARWRRGPSSCTTASSPGCTDSQVGRRNRHSPPLDTRVAKLEYHVGSMSVFTMVFNYYLLNVVLVCYIKTQSVSIDNLYHLTNSNFRIRKKIDTVPL